MPSAAQSEPLRWYRIEWWHDESVEGGPIRVRFTDLEENLVLHDGVYSYAAPLDTSGIGHARVETERETPYYYDNFVLATTEADCNANGTPDVVEVLRGDETDCNANCIPDECEADCNTNGIPDDCDISTGASADCQGNGVPDECDIEGGSSGDCNGNSMPDECEADCNDNGFPDDCDLAGGTSTDCQHNGIPDECETLSRLVSAASCVSHGEAGEWCINLPLNDPAGTDPRLNGGSKLVLVFDLPVDSAVAVPSNIFIERCTGGVIPPEDIFPVLDESETVLTITFDSLPDSQLADGDCYTVVITSVCLDETASFAFTLLAGDANRNGAVDPLDSGAVLARFGCPVEEGDPDCFTSDINNDGATDPLDSGAVLARFGSPACSCE